MKSYTSATDSKYSKLHSPQSVLKFGDLPRELIQILGDTHSKRITAMVCAVIDGSADEIVMKEPVGSAMMELRGFMFERVYNSAKAKSEDKKVSLLIEYLFGYYNKNPDALPEENRKMTEKDGLQRCVCDHIAGMTDRYAISAFEGIYVPKVWSL